MRYILAFHVLDDEHLSFKEFNTLKRLHNFTDYFDKYHRETEIFCCKVLKDISNCYRFKFYKRWKPYPYMENVGVQFNDFLIKEYKEYIKNAYK